MDRDTVVFSEIQATCKELEIVLHNERGYSITNKLHDLRHMSLMNTKKFKVALSDIVSTTPKNSQGYKNIILLNNTLTIHFCYTAIIINKDDITVIFNPELLEVSVWDEHFNIIYSFNYFNQSKQILMNTLSYENEKLGLVLSYGKKRINYLYKQNDNNYFLDIKGASQVRKFLIEKDTITVVYKASEYEKIVFDKNFNMKKISLSYPFYKKHELYLPDRAFDVNSYSELINQLNYSMEMHYLNSDEKIKFPTQDHYNSQVLMLKKIYKNIHLFDIDISILKKFDTVLQPLGYETVYHHGYIESNQKYSDVLNCINFLNNLKKRNIDLFNAHDILELKKLNTIKTFL